MAMTDADAAFVAEVEKWANRWFRFDLASLPWLLDRPNPHADFFVYADKCFPAGPVNPDYVLRKIRTQFGPRGVSIAASMPLLTMH